LPDVYDKEGVYIVYKSNLRPDDYELKIYNFNGNLVKQFKSTAQNKVDAISIDDLPYGCYTLVFEDIRYNYGLH
jgi:hypothetical protein